MKKTVVLCLFAFLGSRAFASPAVLYNCVGKDSLSGQAVTFDLTFADHDSREGYTNQSVTILRLGWEVLKSPITLQMYGATKENECSRNSVGEIYFVGERFDMDPTPVNDIAPYKVTVKSVCAEAKLDLQAYCFFQN